LVVCALARETAKLVPVAGPHPVVTMGPGDHFAGAFSRYLDGLNPKPAWALLAGYSGSLSPAVFPGEVVIASAVAGAPDGNHSPSLKLQVAPQPDLTIHTGPLCTSPRLIATPTEKKSLGKQTGALAVDMESAAFAGICNRFKIPWAVVRVVFDSLDDPLHPKMLRWCDSQGRDNLSALAWDLMTSPGWWWRLPGWGYRDRLAGKSLRQALGGIIQSIGTTRAS